MLLVALGGAVGGALRWTATVLAPDPVGGFGWTTWWVNGVGSFGLGLLLSGTGRAARPWLRAAVGTGLLGGFTTFSAVAHAADVALRAGTALTAIAVLAGSVAVGLVGAALGAAAGAGLSQRGPTGRRRHPDVAGRSAEDVR